MYAQTLARQEKSSSGGKQEQVSGGSVLASVLQLVCIRITANRRKQSDSTLTRVIGITRKTLCSWKYSRMRMIHRLSVDSKGLRIQCEP